MKKAIRLKSLREENHRNMKETANLLNMPYTTYVNYEKAEREPNSETLVKMADFYGVTVDYLIGRTNNRNQKFESNIGTVLPNESIRMIPVYESVSAGFGAYADNYITEYMPLYIANDEEAENTMVIKVSGDSMYPKIEDGDYIQVLKQDYCEDGQIAVVLIDREEGVVKKIKFDDDATTLISINPEYKPRVFTGAEQEKLRIQGIVRKIIKDV